MSEIPKNGIFNCTAEDPFMDGDIILASEDNWYAVSNPEGSGIIHLPCNTTLYLGSLRTCSVCEKSVPSWLMTLLELST